MRRKILRNMMKRETGNNDISRLWRIDQIERMGIGSWCAAYNRCNVNSKALRKNPKTAMQF